MTREELKQEAEDFVMGIKAKEAIQKQIPYFDFAQEMYLAGAEPREKRIAELEKELEQAKKVQVVEHFEAYGQCRDSRRIANLGQENAELRAFRQDCVKLTEDSAVMARQRAETAKQLTKAKEIIRQFLNDYPVITKELLDKLEQFVKDR